MESVFERVESWVDRHPEKLLFSFLDANGSEIERHSYESFLQRVDVIASHLRRRSDIEPGDRALLVYPPGLEMICALFACARAGLIPVPTSPPGPYGTNAALHRMEHIAQDCEAAALLTSRDCNDALQTLRPESGNGIHTESTAAMGLDWIVTEELTELAGSPKGTRSSDIFLLQYTSGSTNRPKGVVISEENVLRNCDSVVDHSAPVTISWLPQHHDMGLLGYYIYILLSGGVTYGFSPVSFIQRPALWFEAITRYGGTATSAPNFAFSYCLRPGQLSEETLARIDLSSLRFLMAAAEPIKADVYRRFLQRFEPYGLRPQSFFVAYGLAENTLAVTNHGRTMVSLSRPALSRGKVRMTASASEIADAAHLMSCGKPLGDNLVKIVDPDTRRVLPKHQIGEIWVSGSSKGQGYWNNPDMTEELFRARIAGDLDGTREYLRTGDMGFFHKEELYVCGRRKDMIIVRGQNYYPQDVESVVEQASPLIRRGSVAAFETSEDGEAAVAIVAGLRNPTDAPDSHVIVTAVRDYLNLEVGNLIFVPSEAVPKTSSGKIMRYKAKQMWLAGEFPSHGGFARQRGADCTDAAARTPLDLLKGRYGIAGDEPHSLIEAGVDSLDLVTVMHELKNILKERGTAFLADQVDSRLIQWISIADLFRLFEQSQQMPDSAIGHFRQLLKRIHDEQRAEEHAMMVRDRGLAFTPCSPGEGVALAAPRSILLIGGTGFLGPFLLKSLLEQTRATIHVLVRGASDGDAGDRLRAAFDSVAGSDESLSAQFVERVRPLRGDLERRSLGLHARDWSRLAKDVDAIYHNGAAVNYLYNYASLRAANVQGTSEVLKLAFEDRSKHVNYISTTFIFGWATKDVLSESDSNIEMELLDFGYSQSKWVAEQLVANAARSGLGMRIFRPALITPSVGGGGSSLDITIRLLAFMIKHGLGVDALNQVSFVPADVTANNIVAIANQSETIGGSYHVTRDDYCNMIDVIEIIKARTGQRFDLLPLKDFVPEVVRRCTRDDSLFPLLDFLIGSVDSISSMEFKRYDNSAYQNARDASPWGILDPSLDDTVDGILRFLERLGILQDIAPGCTV